MEAQGGLLGLEQYINVGIYDIRAMALIQSVNLQFDFFSDFGFLFITLFFQKLVSALKTVSFEL